MSSPGSLNSATASPWPFALSHTKWAFAIAVARTSIAERRAMVARRVWQLAWRVEGRRGGQDLVSCGALCASTGSCFGVCAAAPG